MKYHEYKDLTTDSKTMKELLSSFDSSKRNRDINMIMDYYEGNQWDFTHRDALKDKYIEQTRFTRSGKQAYEPLDAKNISKGYDRSQLKVWNIIKPSVQVYARYVRGDDTDNVTIKVTQGDVANDELTAAANNLFTDLNSFVLNAVIDMSLQSVLVTKYTGLDNNQESKDIDIMQTINFDKRGTNDAIIESIDAREVLPIYWKGFIRGVVRFYNIFVKDGKAMFENYKPGDADDMDNVMYSEHWIITDDGTILVRKYIDSQLVDEAKSPYDFLPYAFEINGKAPNCNFDLDNLEQSDAWKLIDIQDDYNISLTDWGLINRKLAIPILKLSDNFIKEAETEDFERLKDYLSTVRMAAADLITAPIEKVPGESMAASSMKYYDDLRQQINRETGIPTSVYDSGNLANIATETLDHFFESLKKVVGDKRSRISNHVKQLVLMYLKDKGLYSDDLKIEVIYPNIFNTSKVTSAQLIQQGKQFGIISSRYSTKKYLDLLGDTEEAQVVLAEMAEQDAQLKLEIESAMAKRQAQEDRPAIIAEAAQRAGDLSERRQLDGPTTQNTE